MSFGYPSFTIPADPCKNNMKLWEIKRGDKFIGFLYGAVHISQYMTKRQMDLCKSTDKLFLEADMYVNPCFYDHHSDESVLNNYFYQVQKPVKELDVLRRCGFIQTEECDFMNSIGNQYITPYDISSSDIDQLFKDDSKHMFNKLRETSWTCILKEELQEGTSTIAVGLAHISAMISRLEKIGYTIEEV